MVKKILSALLCTTLVYCTLPVHLQAGAVDKLLAFPGAEGGGKYTKGARAQKSVSVYHVTNLNDSGSGSLRDAVSKAGRIIVFDVGGVIKLKSQLKPQNNITILGQTAPGDGITITHSDINIENKSEIILRYMRVRPTDDSGGEPDGIGGRWTKNIVLDHCSVSWGVDELLTLYGGSIEGGKTPSTNISVQYCLSSESLRMSNHIKGAHGYGGIVGGSNATYHHNLFASHDSRSPRFDRQLQNTDFVNNVIYNWGNTNSIYGGEPYSYNYPNNSEYSTNALVSKVNLYNNYYKFGPSTKNDLRSRIYDISNDHPDKFKSDFYINGNFVYGNQSASNNNTGSTAYINNLSRVNILPQPIDMGEYTINAETAEQALQTTLDNVGATLPKRDAIDARIVYDVKNQTGRVINNDEEVGGITGFDEVKRSFAIPDEWKNAHGMNSAKETDIAPSGYTWIEEYVNAWTAEQSQPTNPEITVYSPAAATADKTQDKTNKTGFWEIAKEDEPVTYSMQAHAAEGAEISKIEIYDSETLLYSIDNTDSVETELTKLAPGTHYLISKAYNNKGECTVSPTSIVYVTGTEHELTNVTEIGKAAGSERGSIAYPDKSAAWENNGITYVAGSGFIYGTSDAFTYLYYPVKGDFSITAKLADIPKYENGVLTGIMFRESLDANSRYAMLADTWRKYGENMIVPVRSKTGSSAVFNWMRDNSNKDIKNGSSYDTEKYPMPKYIKAERSGNELTLSVSNTGTNWADNARQPFTIDVSDWNDYAYIGFAADSINGTSGDTKTPLLPWFTIAGFSEIKSKNVGGLDVPLPPTPPPSPTPTAAPPLCKKITAHYDDGSKLLNIEISDAYAGETPPQAETNTKTFYWNSLESMVPIN